jgi:hypothetical protein
MNSDSNWEEKLKNCFGPASRHYAKKVQREAQFEVDKLEIGIKVPTFSPPELNPEVEAYKSNAGKIGAGIGGVTTGLMTLGLDAGITGAIVGGAIGKAVDKAFYSGDAKKDRSAENVAKAARNLLPTLRDEAEKYLERVNKTLAAK